MKAIRVCAVQSSKIDSRDGPAFRAGFKVPGPHQGSKLCENAKRSHALGAAVQGFGFKVQCCPITKRSQPPGDGQNETGRPSPYSTLPMGAEPDCDGKLPNEPIARRAVQSFGIQSSMESGIAKRSHVAKSTGETAEATRAMDVRTKLPNEPNALGGRFKVSSSKVDVVRNYETKPTERAWAKRARPRMEQGETTDDEELTNEPKALSAPVQSFGFKVQSCSKFPNEPNRPFSRPSIYICMSARVTGGRREILRNKPNCETTPFRFMTLALPRTRCIARNTRTC